MRSTEASSTREPRAGGRSSQPIAAYSHCGVSQPQGGRGPGERSETRDSCAGSNRVRERDLESCRASRGAGARLPQNHPHHLRDSFHHWLHDPRYLDDPRITLASEEWVQVTPHTHILLIRSCSARRFCSRSRYGNTPFVHSCLTAKVLALIAYIVIGLQIWQNKIQSPPMSSDRCNVPALIPNVGGGRHFYRFDRCRRGLPEYKNASNLCSSLN